MTNREPITTKAGDERTPTVAPAVRAVLARLLRGHDPRREDGTGSVGQTAVCRSRPQSRRSRIAPPPAARWLRGSGRPQPGDLQVVPEETNVRPAKFISIDPRLRLQ